MRNAVWLLIAMLVILHQDFWYWDDPTLIGGFCPIGLAYHMLLSVAACGTWWLAVCYGWPVGLEIPDSPVDDNEEAGS